MHTVFFNSKTLVVEGIRTVYDLNIPFANFGVASLCANEQCARPVYRETCGLET